MKNYNVFSTTPFIKKSLICLVAVVDEYFKENFKFFDSLDFIAELTAHILTKGKQYISSIAAVPLHLGETFLRQHQD